MIARPLRLRRPYEFERVRKQGRSWTTPLLVLSALPNDLGSNRYGFAVGKRVGGAAKRNRVKRWMREATRHLHPRLRQGHDLVFIARGRLADESVTYHDVANESELLCHRAKLLIPSVAPAGSGPSASREPPA